MVEIANNSSNYMIKKKVLETETNEKAIKT
jgi:hypothetical protein